MKENQLEVYFFNDQSVPLNVETQHKVLPNEYGIYKFKMSDVVCLQPGQGQVFKVDAPIGTSAFVKVWDSRVLITFMDTDKANMA